MRIRIHELTNLNKCRKKEVYKVDNPYGTMSQFFEYLSTATTPQYNLGVYFYVANYKKHGPYCFVFKLDNHFHSSTIYS